MKLYTAEEVAKLLRIATAVIYRFARKGLINCYRMKSGQIRFSEAHIMEFLEGGK